MYSSSINITFALLPFIIAEFISSCIFYDDDIQKEYPDNPLTTTLSFFKCFAFLGTFTASLKLDNYI